MTEEKKKKPCPCGCGMTPEGPKSEFMPGHDARYYGQLTRRAVDGDKEAIAILLERWPQRWADKQDSIVRAAKKQQEKDLARQAENMVRKEAKARETAVNEKVPQEKEEVEFKKGKVWVVGTVSGTYERADGVLRVRIIHDGIEVEKDATAVRPVGQVA